MIEGYKNLFSGGMKDVQKALINRLRFLKFSFLIVLLIKGAAISENKSTIRVPAR